MADLLLIGLATIGLVYIAFDVRRRAKERRRAENERRAFEKYFGQLDKNDWIDL
jgi:cell division protein FtsL